MTTNIFIILLVQCFTCNAKVLVTREELAVRLMVKIDMEKTDQNLVRVVNALRWESFGACTLITTDRARRTVVGIGKRGDARRDFIRLDGLDKYNTALSVQVRIIVKYTSLRTFLKVRSIVKYVILRTHFTYILHTGLYVRKNIWFRRGDRHRLAQRVANPQQE